MWEGETERQVIKAGFLGDTRTRGFCSRLESHYKRNDWKSETECSPVEVPVCVWWCPLRQQLIFPWLTGCHRCCWAPANTTRAIHLIIYSPFRDERVHQYLLQIYSPSSLLDKNCVFIIWLSKSASGLFVVSQYKSDPYCSPCDGCTLLSWVFLSLPKTA